MEGDNLHKVSTEIARINNEIIDAEGVVSPELEKKLDEMGLALRDKAEGIIRWTLNLDGKQEAIDKEIARLQKLKKATKGLRERLEGYVEGCMKTADIKKIELDTIEIAVVKNPPSVEVEDNKALPAQFIETITTHRVDKKAILAALKAGESVTGARLVTDKTRLRVT